MIRFSKSQEFFTLIVLKTIIFNEVLATLLRYREQGISLSAVCSIQIYRRYTNGFLMPLTQPMETMKTSRLRTCISSLCIVYMTNKMYTLYNH